MFKFMLEFSYGDVVYVTHRTGSSLNSMTRCSRNQDYSLLWNPKVHTLKVFKKSVLGSYPEVGLSESSSCLPYICVCMIRLNTILAPKHGCKKFILKFSNQMFVNLCSVIPCGVIVQSSYCQPPLLYIFKS